MTGNTPKARLTLLEAFAIFSGFTAVEKVHTPYSNQEKLLLFERFLPKAVLQETRMIRKVDAVIQELCVP